MNDGVIVLTGDQITVARWLAVRTALRLEIRTGMAMSARARPARVLANEITGGNYRTRRAAYGALDDFIASRLGESFRKPVSA